MSDYNDEELSKIKEMFNFIDKNKKGAISLEDVKLGIIGLGGELNAKDLKELKDKKSFKINDFISICQKKNIKISELQDKLLTAFSFLESDNKGFIQSSSLEAILKNDNVSEKDIKKLIKEAHPDENDNIDYKSFAQEILEAKADDDENEN